MVQMTAISVLPVPYSCRLWKHVRSKRHTWCVLAIAQITHFVGIKARYSHTPHSDLLYDVKKSEYTLMMMA